MRHYTPDEVMNRETRPCEIGEPIPRCKELLSRWAERGKEALLLS
jgi:hypothetical protein